MIARATLQRFRLPLRRPLTTARGTITEREGVLLALTSKSGARGFGEAMPLAGFAGGTLARAEAWLAHTVPDWIGHSADAARLPDPGAAPVARAALETALLDLAAREKGLPLADALADAPPLRQIAVNALIDGGEPRDVAARARRAAARGFRAFKLKLGVGPLDAELARVAALRDAVGDRAALILDANGAWDEAQATRALAALAPFAPEYVEEPVSGIAACARLRGRTPVPIALDESAGDAASADRALRARAADVLVLKLPRLGGPRAARVVALRAQQAGVGVVITSFFDSAVGVVAALHCAASLPELRRPCGLATGVLFAGDLAPLAPELGMLALPDAAGLGVAPDPEALARAATGPLRELRA